MKTIDYRGYKINIYIDDNPESPRAWDNLGIMELTHNRYDLPSEGGGLNFEDVNDKLPDGWEAAEKNLIAEKKPLLILPVIGYDHSGLSISIGTKPDYWDGGRLGFVYTTAAQVKKMGTRKKDLDRILRSEVETYNQYLTGEVYGFLIETPEGEETGGCWGFYGHNTDKNGLESEARSEIDNLIIERAAAELAKVNNYVDLLAVYAGAVKPLIEYLDKYINEADTVAAIKRQLNSAKSIITKKI